MTLRDPKQRRRYLGEDLYSFTAAFFALLAFCVSCQAQQLPREIRGYKVHNAKVNVEAAPRQGPDDRNSIGDADAVVQVPRPRVVDIGLTGIVLEVAPSISPPKQKGKVDLLMFHGITVNGIPLEIEEYSKPFDLPGDPRRTLRLPVKAYIRNTDILRAAYRELVDSKETWNVKGRIFVFGRFKRFGFTFKRVIPVDFDIQIPNPLR
jgi:hypothetical protein